ncbi:MAG: accessory gene regulator ArgB-like protein [Proteocatella sp.]
MNYITDLIVQFMLKHGVIEAEDAEVYQFGLNQLIFIAINLTTTVIIGIVFSMLFESIIFLVSYMVVRVYAGGYHAKTQFRCYIISSLFIVLALMGVKYIIWEGFASVIAITIASMVIFKLSPVETKNKPLDEIETKIYKTKSRQRIVGIYLLCITAKFLAYEVIFKPISMAIIILSIVLLIGQQINRHQKKEEDLISV